MPNTHSRTKSGNWSMPGKVDAEDHPKRGGLPRCLVGQIVSIVMAELARTSRACVIVGDEQVLTPRVTLVTD